MRQLRIHIFAGRRWVAAASLLAALAIPAGAQEAPRPERIVSINMCTDELVLRLAAPNRIASVTQLSQNPLNANMADAARRFPANAGRAEEVLSFRPDLVLAGTFTTRATVSLLKRTGQRVVEVGVPSTLDEVRAQIREVAALLGETDRGEAIIARMDEQLATIAARGREHRPRAIVLRPNGFTAAKGSLVDAILTTAGLTNLAAELDLGHYAQVPLETLVLKGADVLIVAGDAGNGPALAMEVLQHPVIRHLSRRLKVVFLPSRLWTCAGPAVVDAVAALEAATRDIASGPGS